MDIAPHPGQVVFRQPLWKRLLGVLSAVAFVAIGAFLIWDGELWWLGIICILVFGGVGIFAARIPLTVLIADQEGIIPVYALSKGVTFKIPWAKIEKIAVATQTINNRGFNQRIRYLSIYINDPDFLNAQSTVSQITSQLMRAAGGMGLDDGGKAQLYISSMMLSLPLEKAIERLNAYRTNALRSSAIPVSV